MGGGSTPRRTPASQSTQQTILQPQSTPAAHCRIAASRPRPPSTPPAGPRLTLVLTPAVALAGGQTAWATLQAQNSNRAPTESEVPGSSPDNVVRSFQAVG